MTFEKTGTSCTKLNVSSSPFHSPAPHQPLPTPELLSSDDFEPVEGSVEVHDQDTATLQLSHTDKHSLRILQKNNHLEAVVEHCSPVNATFFLGEGHDDVAPERPNVAEQTHQRSSQIQTPVEVHSPVGIGFENDCEVESNTEKNLMALDTGTKTGPVPLSVPQGEAGQWDSCVDVNGEKVSSGKIPEKSVSSETAQKCVAFEDNGSEEQVIEHHIRSEESVLETVSPEKQVLDHHVISEVGSSESHVTDISCPEEPQSSSRQTNKVQSEELERTKETALQSAIHKETHKVHSEPEVQHSGTPFNK